MLGAGLGQPGRLDPGGQDRPVGDQIGVDARVRLDVGVRRAEQLAGVLGGHALDGVDVLAAGVEAVPDGAFGVLVGQPAAHGQQHGGRGVVLAGDQLERITLVGKLFACRRGDPRLDGLDDLQRRAVGGAGGVGVLGAGRRSVEVTVVSGHADQPSPMHKCRRCLRRRGNAADGISGSSSSRPNRSASAHPGGPVVQPAAQQPVTLDVGAGVGPPQRRGQKPQRLPGAGVVDQQPAPQESRQPPRRRGARRATSAPRPGAHRPAPPTPRTSPRPARRRTAAPGRRRSRRPRSPSPGRSPRTAPGRPGPRRSGTAGC